MTRLHFALLPILPFLAACAGDSPDAGKPPVWVGWTPEVFAEARLDRRPVLVDLEAKWCHWCHVMDEKTYADPRVAELLREKFVTVRVDQDSRPDLAARYEDYGWPATIVFSPDGKEVAKRAGFVRPGDFLTMLQGVLAGKTDSGDAPAQPKEAGGASESRVAALRGRLFAGYDEKEGGWGFSHKFVDADTVLYASREAMRGDTVAAEMAGKTLRLGLRLLDPAWGGFYQYSAGGNWGEPHYEKLLLAQADDLFAYSSAYSRTGDESFLKAAKATRAYVARFLTAPDACVYVSQDADLHPGEHAADYFALPDAERTAKGIPKVDTHVYARENGAWIRALVRFSESTGDAAAGVDALKIAGRTIAVRSFPGGGFRHDDTAGAGPYLADTLAMGRAFLALREYTQDPSWAVRAEAAAAFIETHFRMPGDSGYAASDVSRPAFPAPLPQYDENAGVARFASELARITGSAERLAMSRRALAFVLRDGNAGSRGYYVGGALLAERECSTDPVHVTVVGPQGDPATLALLDAARAYPDAHRLVESWDPALGPAPRGEDIYPKLATPAAFLCADGACSSPLDSPGALSARLKKTAP